MKSKDILLLTFMLLWAGVQPALANQPPGPLVALPEISILPLMILFTLLGGGYTVLKHGGKRKFGVLKVILAVCILFISFAHEGLAVLICVVFGIIALVRAQNLIVWGVRARSIKDTPAHLEDAVPTRLIAAGLSLTIITLFLVGLAAAFVAVWPMEPKRVEKGLAAFVAHQLAHARIEKAKTGHIRFNHQLTRDEYNFRTFWAFRLSKNVQVEYGADNQSFMICIPPQGHVNKFPFFPYNYLTSYPTYRGDETGQIRMSYTTNRHECCPEDAPVVMTVSEAEIENAAKSILEQRPAN